MFEVSDELGNKFFVENKELACKIVNEKDNPFVNMVEYKKECSKGTYNKILCRFLCIFLLGDAD